MLTSSRKQAALTQVFDGFGYSEDYRRRNYPIWTGRQVLTVPLAGFGVSEAFDMTTATMVGIIPNGHSAADGFQAARALAAPLAVVARDDDVELWAVAAVPEETKRVESAPYAELPRLAGSFGQTLGRTEIWRSKQTGHQLSLLPIDVRLLAQARRATSESLAELVEHAMQIGMSGVVTHDAERLRAHVLEVSRVVVGAMAALMLRDKGDTPDAPLDSVLRAAAEVHPRYFTWMQGLSPRLGKALPDIVSLLANAANFASLDASAVGRVYEEAITTPAIRRRYGIFYTPPALAERIVSAIPFEALPPNERTVHDPACGSGTLLIAAHQRLAALTSRVGQESTDYLRQMLTGADQDALAVDLARLALLLTAAGDGWSVDQQALDPTMPLRGPSRPRIIISNPPWLYRRTPTAGREQIADRFIHWILDSVAPGGFIALILPSSWLSTRTSTHARDELRRRASVFEVWRLTEEVFAASDQAPCLRLTSRPS